MSTSTKPFEEVVFCYLGDARFNMADRYLVGGAKLGMDVRIASPQVALAVRRDHLARLHARRGERSERHDHRGRRRRRCKGCDFLLTDVWVSMGEPAEAWKERIELLTPYQINAETMKLTGNPDTKFMHCLPAFHNTDTQVGKELYEKYGLEALEVTEEVFESPASIVFDEAENRLHTIKAVMVATLGSR